MNQRHHATNLQEHAEAAACATLLTGIYQRVMSQGFSLADETPSQDETDAPLEEAVREEREYVRRRLREELAREPTEEEVDDWLRRHTEGY